VDIWAPELHIIDDYWWVYFSGAQPGGGNATHRMYALRGPSSSVDPMDPTSTFTLEGAVRGLPDKWAIDGTVFYINNDAYFAYSGWPLDAKDDLRQDLFIAKMTDPVTTTGADAISLPQLPWETWKDPTNGTLHAINEGPAWLEMGTFKGIIYSAGASWTDDYQLGILQYIGGDPLQITSWKKDQTQLLVNNPSQKGPYGPGHCSYGLFWVDVGLFCLQMEVKRGSCIMQLQIRGMDGINARHVVN
jgi:GH43 family beta-xylosidase